MAIAARYQRDRVSFPQLQGAIPSSFGVSSGIDDLTRGLTALGTVLASRKKQEDQISANTKIAQLEQELVGDLKNIDMSAPSNARIDEQFKTLFDQKSKALIDSAQSNNERIELSQRLPSMGSRLLIGAMGMEVKRNKVAIGLKLQEMSDTFVNGLSSSSADPEKDATTYRDQFGRAVTQAAQVGNVDNIEKIELLRKGHIAINTGMVLGLLRKDMAAGKLKDPNGAFARLNKGEWDAGLTPQAKESLRDEGEKLIRQQDSDAKRVRGEMISDMRAQIADIEKELRSGYIPDTSIAKSLATKIGGEEGKAFNSAINLYETFGQQVTEFAKLPDWQRELAINALIIKRNMNELSPEERVLHDLVTKAHSDIRREATDDAYSMAARYRIIGTPVSIGPGSSSESMRYREGQALQIVGQFGFEANTLTPAELGQVKQTMTEGSTTEQKALIVQFASTPTMRQTLIRSLAKDSSPQSRQLMVAFQLGAQGADEEVNTILKGISMIKGGAPVPSPEIWVEAQNNAFKNIFVGMEDVAAAYRDAGIAYYSGSRTLKTLTPGGSVDKGELKNAMRAVLPGNIDERRNLLTPSKKVSVEAFNKKLVEMETNLLWYRNATWYDPITGTFDPATATPTYANGETVVASDFTRHGTIGMTGHPGIYRIITPGGLVTDGNKVLMLNFRDMK